LIGIVDPLKSIALLSNPYRMSILVTNPNHRHLYCDEADRQTEVRASFKERDDHDKFQPYWQQSTHAHWIIITSYCNESPARFSRIQ